MIADSYIKRSLKLVCSEYANSRDQRQLLIHSKVAVIELCGWIETSMDDIFYRMINRNVAQQNQRDELRKKIDSYSGFNFDQYFKKMILDCVGFVGFVKLQKSIDPVKDQLFRSELGTLTKIRNELAHTYIKGTTAQFDAPSVTISRLPRICDGLREYDRALKAMF
jgi:hypothetical protein